MTDQVLECAHALFYLVVYLVVDLVGGRMLETLLLCNKQSAWETWGNQLLDHWSPGCIITIVFEKHISCFSLYQIIPRKATIYDFSLALNINICVAQAWNIDFQIINLTALSVVDV